MALKPKAKPRKSSKDNEKELVKRLKVWQSIEDDSIRMAKQVQSKTGNPLVKLVMEIIAHDSAMHRRVQQFIVDSIIKEPISLHPEELEEIWDIIEKHQELERSAIGMADELKGGRRLFVQRYLLNYLMEDERKHDSLLDRLEEIKIKMYPY
jgi:Cdc6-like AAA superfamily ATPase